MKHQLLAVSGLALTLAMGAAACSSSGSSSAASGSSSPTMAASSAPAAAGSSAPAVAGSGAAVAAMDFGMGCASVPKSGSGSFTGMATAPVATAASANPLLSTLVAAVKAAGLVDTLNSAKNITVFAPDNAAFAKIPAATLKGILANKAELTKILTYHVAGARYTPAQLASGAKIKTLEGGSVTPAMMSGNYTVNGAQVVCGNVQTANATVYIINTVLTPPSS
ncbi:MAG: fasciclin domain-containing protein [Streptosporangiaceae bacterium]